MPKKLGKPGRTLNLGGYEVGGMGGPEAQWRGLRLTLVRQVHVTKTQVTGTVGVRRFLGSS